MIENFFETEFGHKIPITEEYRKAHNKADYRSFEETTFKKSKTFEEEKGEFLGDLFEYALVFDFLESWGITNSFKTSLDIGGQQGFFSKLLTAEGKCQYSDCVEIYDYQSGFDFNKFVSFYSKLKLANNQVFRKISKLNRMFKSMEDKGTKFGYHSLHKSKLWNMQFPHSGTIRNYILDDVYNLNNKYDFISAILCLSYFNHSKFFQKISNLLSENGVFVFLVDYWWWPVNSTRIVGNFPYAAQRLSRTDFIRYVNEYHHEEKDQMLKKYDYFGNGISEKPTLQNYISEAEKHDLSLIGYNRFMPFQDTHLRTPMTPKILSQYSDTNLDEVLYDIHKFRSDVNIEDLKTSFILVAFQKNSKKNKPISEYTNQLKKNGYGFYRKHTNN